MNAAALQITSNVPVAASVVVPGNSGPGVLTAATAPISEQAVVAGNTSGDGTAASVLLSAPGAVAPEGLMAFCRARAAHFKCPRAIDLVESLPRTGSGKIDKKALREPFWRGRARRIN